MTYVISDIHGDYERYMKMLDLIKLDEDNDVLFVLGNVIDFGEGSFDILLDMSSRPNVYPVMGEHEYMALPLLQKLAGDISEKAIAKFDAETMQNFMKWGKNGGQETVMKFRELDKDDREWVIEYLEEFMPYEEIDVNGKEFVLVHAGLDNFSKSRDLDDYDIEELIYEAPDWSKVYFGNKTLVVGHTPTVEINPSSKGKIWNLNGTVAINCGSSFGLPLGCIRLDDMKEFYID
ncbi:MAG: metallophosphoesterase [Clostridia bacterium]|nr:metallophosphoesterase [Clostridia bacterium]